MSTPPDDLTAGRWPSSVLLEAKASVGALGGGEEPGRPSRSGSQTVTSKPDRPPLVVDESRQRLVGSSIFATVFGLIRALAALRLLEKLRLRLRHRALPAHE